MFSPVELVQFDFDWVALRSHKRFFKNEHCSMSLTLLWMDTPSGIRIRINRMSNCPAVLIEIRLRPRNLDQLTIHPNHNFGQMKVTILRTAGTILGERLIGQEIQLQCRCTINR